VVFPSLDRLFNPQVCLEVLKDLAWYALLTGDRPRLEQAVRRLIDDPRDWGVLRPLADALPGAMGLAPRTAEPVHLPGLFANVIWAFLDGEPDAGPRRPIPAGGPPQPGHPMEQVGTAILAYLDGDLRGAEQTVVALGLHPAEARPFFLAMLAHCAADAGSHTEAARLLGAADVLRERSGLQWFPRFLAAGRAEAEHATRTALGQQRFSAAYAEGSSLDADHAVAYALRAHGQRSRPPADRPASPRPSCRSPSMSPPAGRTRRSPPPCPSAGRPSNPPVPHLPQTPSDQPRRTRRRSRPPPAPAPAMAEPALIHLTSPASQLADAVRAGTPAADHGSLP